MNINSNMLFVAYKTHPIKGVGSIRSSKLIKYLSPYLKKIFVISTLNNVLFYKENYLEVKDNIYFCRIPTLDYQTIKLIIFRFLRFFKKDKKKLYTFEISNKNFWYDVFTIFPINILIGQGGFIYIFLSVLTGIFLIKKYKIKYVFSSFSPFADHIIGYVLKILFPSIIWVADFRDLHIDRVKNRISNSFYYFNLIVEKMILKKADALTTVSKGLKKILRKYNLKTFVISNGFDPDDMYIKTRKNLSKKLTFLYGGALYEGRRDPSFLLESLSMLIKNNKIKKRDLKLYYAGREGSLFYNFCKEFNLEKNCHLLGFLDREDILELERKSSFLIMLTWASKDETGILSGKFYEYLSSGKPIICLINGEGDLEIENIFNKLKCGIAVSIKDKNGIYKLSKYILKYYLNPNKKVNFNWAEIYKFSYEIQAKKLLSLFLKLRCT